MRLRITTFVFAAALCMTACGGEPGDEGPTQRFEFQRHALLCEVPGCFQLPEGVTCLQAKLEATGVPGVCPLNVLEDRTVSGSCRTPAHEVRDFRLVYYSYVGTVEVQLAVVLARLDLREETKENIRLEFPQDHLMTDFDEDQDGRTNLAEICAGTNPTIND